MSEQLLPLSELADQLPAVRRGKKIHRTTLYRWATAGLKSRSGKRIRLETKFIGGTICSSVEAVNRLSQRKSDVEYVDPPSPMTQWEREEMEARGRAAGERLDRLGIGVSR